MGYMGTGDTGTLDFVEHNQEMNEAVAKNLDLADEVAKIKASMFQWEISLSLLEFNKFSQQLYTSNNQIDARF